MEEPGSANELFLQDFNHQDRYIAYEGKRISSLFFCLIFSPAFLYPSTSSAQRISLRPSYLRVHRRYRPEGIQRQIRDPWATTLDTGWRSASRLNSNLQEGLQYTRNPAPWRMKTIFGRGSREWRVPKTILWTWFAHCGIWHVEASLGINMCLIPVSYVATCRSKDCNKCNKSASGRRHLEG